MNSIVLCALTSPLKSRRWACDHTICIGGNPHDITCEDGSLSGEHAKVVKTPQGWFLFNESKHKGTFLNGDRVGPQGHKLHRFDVIECGNLALRVLEGDPELIRTSGHVIRIQAIAHRSWERALSSLTNPETPPSEQCRHLLTLFRTGYHLCRVDCPELLMQTLLDDIVAVLDAQRGSIVLHDDCFDRLQLAKTAQSGTAPPFRKWFSRTLAHRCFRRGESVLCHDIDCKHDNPTSGSTLRHSMASIICALLRTPRKKLGILHLDRSPKQAPFTIADFSLADAIAASVSAGIESAQLLVQQRELFLHTVTAMARAVEIRDRYTGGHTQRVTDYSLLLAQALNVFEVDQNILRVGTPLHDVGKIGIADSILQKPGALTSAEFDEMRKHTEIGYDLLAQIPGLRPMLPIVRHHHERWDGAGYPDHLKRKQIPQLARIVAVADAFDAMTSDRPYRRALSLDQAFHEIAHNRGKHFDPDCADAFLRARARIEGNLAAQTNGENGTAI